MFESLQKQKITISKHFNNQLLLVYVYFNNLKIIFLMIKIFNIMN